ncbi:MAG TPA: carboxypeptidase regulatory-like domain-containing protein [Longimicrobiales bacterium]|nr:carboxypeptidase regulatory-like domain-containing protein [Longimicrobiales bacterium]
MKPRRAAAPALPLLLGLLALADAGSAQSTSTVSGTVLAASGEPVAGAIVRIAGTDASAATDGSGGFVLRGLPIGDHTLVVQHADFGSHTRPLRVARGGERFEVVIRLSPEGMEVALVDAVPATPAEAAVRLPAEPSGRPTAMDAGREAPRGASVLDRARIRELAPSSRDLGDLIRQGVPTLRERQSDDLALAGTGFCLEFRGASVRSMRQGLSGTVCNHPTVYLDGVPMQDPSSAYRMAGFDAIEWIQAIPPGEAGAQFGAAPYGVIVVVTTGSRMGVPSAATARPRRTFDWSQDPEGHSFFRTALGAAVGNAAGLAAGLAVGRECIYVDELKEIDRSCGKPGVVGAGLAAVLLPALGSALGARMGGRTDVSVGRTVPALIGAGMMIVPGYAFSLSTVGDGVQTMNTVGRVLLVAGTPVVVTLADRLYRRLRDR